LEWNSSSIDPGEKFARSSNLALQSAFSVLKSNIAGQASTTTLIDTNAASLSPLFYRVGVQH